MLQGKVDVWALGATSEVGDDTLTKLTDILKTMASLCSL